MNIVAIKPQYGVTYKQGYVFFTNTGDFVSNGVAYFESWRRMGDIKVSHVGIVTGDNEGVEAHIKTGVARCKLDKYVGGKNKIFFRKPRYWSPDMGARIADAAEAQIGQAYDTSLIVGRFLAGTKLGALLNRITRGAVDRYVSKLFDAEYKKICSETAAFSLSIQPELEGLGCLAAPHRTIDPQVMFEDDVIFEPWKHQLKT